MDSKKSPVQSNNSQNALQFLQSEIQNRIPLYEDLLCFYMNIIEENTSDKDAQIVLSYHLYLKYLTDFLINRIHHLNQNFFPSIQSLIPCIVYVFEQNTGLMLQTDEKPLPEIHQMILISGAASFQTMCKELYEINRAIKSDLSSEHRESLLSMLEFALTKMDFYNYQPLEIIHGGLKWLSIRFEIDIAHALNLSNNGQSDISQIFSKIAKEIQQDDTI